MVVANKNMSLSLVSFLLILTGCKSSHGHYNKHAALFIFGDSIFDPGNNNYINTTTLVQANYWPYGESYFYPPSGRFSDGRIIPDFIAEFVGLPLIPAYLDPHNNDFLYGANFASASAGVLDDTNSRYHIVNLKTQVQYFTDLVKHYRKTLGDAKAEQLLSDAVYLFSCGSNDYGVFFERNESNLSYEKYVGMVIGNLTNVFQAIHKQGGRKIGITMLNPLGCLLSVRLQRPDNSCDEKSNIISSLHDKALSKKLHELAQQLEGFTYAKFEIHIELIKRMENPSKYGFRVGDNACCGSILFRSFNSCGGKRGIREFELCDDPNDYLYFDIHHPTEAGNRQLAKLFWSGESKVTSPCNLKALFQDTCAVVSDFHSNRSEVHAIL